MKEFTSSKDASHNFSSSRSHDFLAVNTKRFSSWVRDVDRRRMPDLNFIVLYFLNFYSL